jgi:DNA-binding MarR family transcriptional regulator
LLKLSRRIDARLRENLRREFATTLPRFDVMSALNRYPEGLKMSQLSQVLRVSGGNVTGIVDRLADDGLAERVAVPGDRRAAMVRLTRTGRDEFARQATAHEGWIDALLGDVSRDEAEEMSQRLAQLGAPTNRERAEP